MITSAGRARVVAVGHRRHQHVALVPGLVAVDGDEASTEEVAHPSRLTGVGGNGVAHHGITDRGPVEQPLHRRVVGRDPVDALRCPRRLAAALGDRPLPVAPCELLDVAAADQQLLRVAVEPVRELSERVHRRGVTADLDELIGHHVHRLAEVPDARDVPDERVAVERLARAPSHRLQVGREAGAHDLHLALVDTVRVPHHDVVDLVVVLEEADRVVGHQDPILA